MVCLQMRSSESYLDRTCDLREERGDGEDSARQANKLGLDP